MEDIRQFSKEQQEAICHKDGAMLVLAGPGSGKTTVIAHRVKHLIEKDGVSGSHILVITFTKAAANEMHARFEQLSSHFSGVTFGTFHSVFFMILRKAYGYDASNIIQEAEKYQIVRNIIEKKNLNYDGQEDFAKNVIAEIGYVKSEMVNIDTYESSNMKPEDFRLVYQAYEDMLRKENKIDFDDMLVFTYELLRDRPDIRRMWQQRFRYILIDEFQDINRIQYDTIRLLLGREKNIFAVGDDDQSVYSFRGADTKIMLGFPEDFPGTKIICLNINYRCSSAITDSARRMIQKNQKRYKKEMISAFKKSECERIHVVEVDGMQMEQEEMAKKIRALNENGIAYSNMAVLYRTNSEPAGLAMKLMQYNIPFKMKDKIPDWLSHFVVVNILDYIKLALGSRERELALRIINRPNRYISRDCFSKEQINFEELKEYYKDNNSAVQRLVTLENDLNRIKNLKPYAAVNYIRKAVGYDDYLKTYAEYRGMDYHEYLDIADEFQEMARNADSYDKWFAMLQEYRDKINERKKQSDYTKDMVTLATMHSAKGLEFDQVFILNGVEGMTPHKKSVSDDEMEEERRMFYVAVTRARYGLYIYVPKVVYGKPGKRSRFVDEMVIDRELLAVGNRIIHKRYGKGTITYADDKKICVYFENGNVSKTLSIEYTTKNNLVTMPED